MADFIIITAREGKLCRWCDKAKALIAKHGYTYETMPFNDGFVRFFELIGAETVPQIWNGRGHVGGYEDLVAMLDRSTPINGGYI